MDGSSCSDGIGLGLALTVGKPLGTMEGIVLAVGCPDGSRLGPFEIDGVKEGALRSVGERVGFFVGIAEGSEDGDRVVKSEGIEVFSGCTVVDCGVDDGAEGSVLGLRDGLAEGTGVSVFFLVGLFVGAGDVGSKEGLMDGRADGSSDGASDGRREGPFVGDGDDRGDSIEASGGGGRVFWDTRLAMAAAGEPHEGE